MSTDDLFGAGLTASRDVGGGAHSGGYLRICPSGPLR
jgi:hypothetical protein